ncbi:MAG: HEAT repeat domain-containing protein [candidate division Zixibacteria bacterium]|nr:HEAT repeat domain-containing protein [candidate division Zixibacteria bacterium]
MKNLIIILLLLLAFTTSSNAEVEKSALDSLWIKATSGLIRFQEEVQPSKDALIEHGEDAVGFLIDKMDTRSAREMHTLVDILGKIGNTATLKVCGQLESDDYYRVNLATRILEKIKDSTSVEYLLQHAQDSLYNIRSGVASALGGIGHKSATGTLLKLASESDYTVRKSATVALGKMPFEEVYPALLTNLSDSYYGVRYTAANSIVGFEKDAVKALKDFIERYMKDLSSFKSDDEIFGIALAVDCLGKIGDKKSSKLLKKVSKISGDYLIRGYALRALGAIGGKSNIKFLHKSSETVSDPFVQAMIAEGLDIALSGD